MLAGAGLATALFMVHPLRVEAVAWASGQAYLPCAFFSMLAVLAYLRAFEVGSCPQWGWLVAAFVLFIAALLFHALAVSLPAVLLILDVYPLRRFGEGPGGLVRVGGAEGMAGEGPVYLCQPYLHGPGRRGQAANLGPD